MLPEVYSEEERKAVEAHIEACFGAFETVRMRWYAGHPCGLSA